MKKLRTKQRIRIYKTDKGYAYYDSSASCISANIRKYTDLIIEDKMRGI